MVIVGWLLVALSAWLLDSAISGRPPLKTAQAIISGQPIPGKASSAPGQDSWDRARVPAPSGSVQDWINQATAILEQNGYRADQLNSADIALIIQNESHGNPNAINLYDSNAAAGHPSQGLMQTIPSTFAEHALPGHGNITDPVDNIIAGVRYAIGKYGSLDNVPGVKAVRSGQKYVGY